MENINEENPYEIYSKTMYKLNITVANIDPTDIDNIISRLESVTAIDLDKFAGEALFTLGGIMRDAKSILDMACELQSDFDGETQKFLMRLKVLELATIGFKGMVSDLWKTIYHPLFNPDPIIPRHSLPSPTSTNPELDNNKRKYPAPPPYGPTQSPFWCDVRKFTTNLLRKYQFHA
jgi:hypothetical protein